MNRAGDAIRAGQPSEADIETVNEWRAAHRAVINTFQALLRNKTKGKQIKVAQRHKRRNTIFNKLNRFPGMRLARMDDVAGCRLIFESIEKLYDFRAAIHKARFKHELKNASDKYDYIKHPKETGYRGIHDVYSYDVNSEAGKRYKGLLIELQYRTLYQHAWATAVEVIGSITESQPKFQQGDKRYEIAMGYASEIIARAYEDSNSYLPDLADDIVVSTFRNLDEQLGLLQMLRALNAADKELPLNRNVILIFGVRDDVEDLQFKSFRDAPEALRALFQLEKDNPGKDVVLVRADTTEDMRLAFQNYFSDAKEFVNLIEQGCEELVGRTATGA